MDTEWRCIYFLLKMGIFQLLRYSQPHSFGGRPLQPRQGYRLASPPTSFPEVFDLVGLKQWLNATAIKTSGFCTKNRLMFDCLFFFAISLQTWNQGSIASMWANSTNQSAKCNRLKICAICPIALYKRQWLKSRISFSQGKVHGKTHQRNSNLRMSNFTLVF